MDRTKVFPLLKGVLVLALIALCSGLLLGLFNRITYVDPLQSAYDRFAADTGKAFSKMADREGKTYGEGSVIYYAVSDDGSTQAFLAEGLGGFKGAVQLYVYLSEGKIIKIVVGDHNETYMDKLEEANFYANFVGKEIASLNVSSVDVVSGASRSSGAVKNAIGAVVQYCKEITEA